MQGQTVYKVVAPIDKNRVVSTEAMFQYNRGEPNEGGNYHSWHDIEYAREWADDMNKVSGGLNNIKIAEFFIPEGAEVIQLDEHTLRSNKIIFKGIVGLNYWHE